MSTKPNQTGRTYHHYRHNNHHNRSNQTNHLSKGAKYSPKNASRDPNHNGTARNDSQPSTSNHGGRKSTGGNMKSKRLPWNTDIIKDRFTPQPYHIQLMDYYLYSSRFDANFLILMQNDEWKNYLKTEFVRYYHQHYQQCSRTTAKLAIFITNMGSDVSKYVELISRHTTVKLAGVDQHFTASPETLLTLKQDANLFIMSVTVLLEWLRRGLLLLDEIGFIIFNDVNGAFQHNQDSYEQLMNVYVRPNLSKCEVNGKKALRVVGFAALNIGSGVDAAKIAAHIDRLRTLFGFELVETATDLVDTQNIFNGFQPKECLLVSKGLDIADKSSTFYTKLIEKIRTAYLNLESFMSAPNAGHLHQSTAAAATFSSTVNYINQLSTRVINECVYLLNEVGVWCLAKSLLPFICQLDKLANYIEKQHGQNSAPVDSTMDLVDMASDPVLEQILTLQYTSTFLRELREMCIKQIVHCRASNQLFLNNYTTPKVKSLVNLLRSYASHADEFCCLLFVQNKQVACSLSLLLKKLAKEDHSLSYICPNYIIGSVVASPTTETPTAGQTDDDCLKQEEILKKFYSGEINLLICTYEMEPHVQSPNGVNLIIRFNCDVSGTCGETLPFDYFSYVSTKTRAKTKHSKCYFFIDKANFNRFLSEFKTYKQIERLLVSNYSNLIELNRSVLSNEHSLQLGYGKLTLQNAVFYLNRYCIRLPSDALTQLTVKFNLERDASTGRVRCTLSLPINSGVRHTFQSDWEQSEELAKASVAYKTCLELVLINELNEHLEPITKELFYKQVHKMDEDDEREWSLFQKQSWHNNQHQNSHHIMDVTHMLSVTSSSSSSSNNYMSHRPGGNKRKQIYARKVSPYLKSLQVISTQQPCYLYAIKCTLTTPISQNGTDTKSKVTADNGQSNSWCFGLVASKPLLEVVDFSIFTQSGEETTSIKLIKTQMYLTPNQLKYLKIFHKFLFSNVLRMEGRGAFASKFISSYNLNNSKTQHDQMGCLLCLLKLQSENAIADCEPTYDVDWELMKSIDGCTDKSFLRVPSHASRFMEELIEQEDGDMTLHDQLAHKVVHLNLANYECKFDFDPKKYTDAVVIPYYRSTDNQPQFYCVQSIDYSLGPLSAFPSSSHNKPSFYETFFHYFAYKYNIRITNLDQPLLVVTHPSTRLNLLTPRYMNMKAIVLQKSHHSNVMSTTSVRSDGGAIKKQPSQTGSSSNQIFLVPELVNLHPLSASVWRRSLCIPSILYRLNSLLIVEELRREIARSTGVGVPWINEEDGFKFDKLEFHWDATKELEASNVPDVEIDLANIEHNRLINESSSSVNKALSGEDEVDPKWNFEISTWDDSCLKELNAKLNPKTSLFSGMVNLNNPFGSGPTTDHSGWNDTTNCKTLFIDPNDMDLFGVDFLDDIDDEEAEYRAFEMAAKKDSNANGTTTLTDQQPKETNPEQDSDDEFGMNEHDVYSRQVDEPHKTISHDQNSNGDMILEKYSIDLNTLRADMKQKSAKLLSKLSANSNNLVKTLVSDFTNEPPNMANNTSQARSGEENSLPASSPSTLIELEFNLSASTPSISSSCSMYGVGSGQVTLDEQHLNEHAYENDWLTNLEFYFDLDKLDPSLEAFLKNLNSFSASNAQHHLPLNASNLLHDKFKTIALPVNKKEIEKMNLVEKGKQTTPTTSTTTNCNKQNVVTEPPQSLRNTDWSFNFSLDDQNGCMLANELGPGPAILLQALTLSNAADGFDLERLETVGDSFLKHSITVYLFFTYPSVNEGKLSFLRSKQVSNYNLYKLGKRKSLQELIVSSKFEPLETWLPPHYESVLGTSSSVDLYSSLYGKLNEPGTTMERTKPTNNPAHTSANGTNTSQQQQKFDKYKDHVVSDKSIADSVEAIIGAYLITSGPHAALQVMSWFGLEVLPKAKCEDGSVLLVNLPEVQAPMINDPLKLAELYRGLETFEACIGYKFKQPFYVVQAFTHASYTHNSVTDCYQRLEFLGDAILDYVITRHLYEYRVRLSPGELTDLRSALVNNNIFAYLAVKFEFYKYFKYSSPVLFSIIDSFVQNQKQRNDEFDLDEDFFDFPIDDDDEDDDEDDYYLMEGAAVESSSPASDVPSSHELEELEVPKCLGDIFESVAGAIYLDSNKSLDTVWRVYYSLMKPYIDKFTANVPKSPIRELLELEPETVKFEKPERTIDGKIRVCVCVFGKGKFKGVGRNYRIAKNAAAKLALKFLKNQKGI